MSCNCKPSSQCPRQAWGWVKKNNILVSVAAAVILGVCLGLALRPAHLSHDAICWIKIWGELFLRMIKLIVLPLIMACIVVGLSNLEAQATGKLGLVTLVWIFTTQIIAVIIGIALTVAIHPGHHLGGSLPQVNVSTHYTDVFGDFLRNLFPDNIVRACLENAYTERWDEVEFVNRSHLNGSEVNSTDYIVTVASRLLYRDGMNTIGVVTFSMMIGFGIQATGSKSKPLVDLFGAIYVVVFKIMDFIIKWYSPLGILSLISGALLEVEDLTDTMRSVGLYVLTVISGLAIHMVVILPVALAVLTRKNPFKVALHLMDGILAGTAAATGMVAMPYFLKVTQEKMKVDPRVANFVLPIETTINKDGSALYICVSAIFLAQTYEKAMTFGDYLILGLLVTLLCAAVAAVPSASVVVLIMVSTVIGVPVEDRLGLLMAVEWLLDRLRTTANLQSNGFGIIVVDHFCSKDMLTKISSVDIAPEKGCANHTFEDEANVVSIPL